jgi:uncharacterized membrane protein YdcZ (DUF606 family)
MQAQIEPALSSTNSAIPIEIIANFVVGALNTLIIWWLENDRPYPAEEMAQIFHRLLLNGIGGTAAQVSSDSVAATTTPDKRK